MKAIDKARFKDSCRRKKGLGDVIGCKSNNQGVYIVIS